VVAYGIEMIGVQSGRGGLFQTLVQLDIENRESEAKGGEEILLSGGFPDAICPLPDVDGGNLPPRAEGR
jgi:hypothetical protein